MKQLALLGMVILTSSCATATTSFTPVCAPVVSYTKGQQVTVANELKACGDKCTETKEFLKDGAVLRQANRECGK